MKVTHLRVTGFKSFVEPVELRIEPGLTGIVGPNGCGKSNILESLRWVMGATSAKALRGGEMDDVIFAGTDQRPARDIADVTLVLDNSDGRAPAPFDTAPHLEITRRIRRGAGSNFKINGKEVRARDVQLLFADASTGANSPALVRQNQVSELINAKPENRRRILEEAAGIAGLYARRHEAELKLSGAQANLERLDDVIAAMQEQLTGLRRQAKQAARYRSLADEIRGLEAFLAAKRYAQAELGLAEAKEARALAETALADATLAANAATREAEAAEQGLPALREEQMIADAVLRRLEGQRFGLERDLAKAHDDVKAAESELARLSQDMARETALREDANNALARVEGELLQVEGEQDTSADLQAKTELLHKAQKHLTEIEARHNDAVTRRAQLASTHEAQARACVQAREQAARRHKALQAAEEACTKAKSTLPSPDGLARAQTAVEQATQQAAQAAQLADSKDKDAEAARAAETSAREQSRQSQNARDRLHSEIAALSATSRTLDKAKGPKAIDAITPKAGYERALAAALGDDLDAALSASEPIAWTGSGDTDQDLPDIVWPQGAVILADVVESAPAALRARLLAVACVSSEQFEANGPMARGIRYVTQAGDLRRWDGFVRRAHALSSNAAVMEQRTRLTQLQARLPEVEERAHADAQMAAKARAHADQAQAAAKAARAGVPAAYAAVNAARDALFAEKSAFDRATSHLQQAQIARDGVRSEYEQAQALVAVTETLLAQLPPLEADADEFALLQSQLVKARAQANQAGLAVSLVQREAQARTTRRNSLRTDQDAWSRRIAQAQARLSALAESEKATQDQLKQAKAAPEQIEARRREILSALPAAQARKRAADDALIALESAIRAAQDQARITQARLADCREARAQAHSRHEAAGERLGELMDDIRRTLQLDPDQCAARARLALGDAYDNLTPQQGQSRLAKLLYDRDALGGVNLRAEEEVEQHAARLDALVADKNDLNLAIAKLRGGVEQINKEGKARLDAAFDVVHTHFQALFSKLFDGGVSELRLTQSDDPLGGGLEVYACPPGKKLQSLSLMSGGEQALTASALIFAVFLSNPSPICVLDEVDAPLD
ncbi:MAG: hypothetical protein RLZZ157_412, partial [Pseudomonadota bacterium]